MLHGPPNPFNFQLNAFLIVWLGISVVNPAGRIAIVVLTKLVRLQADYIQPPTAQVIDGPVDHNLLQPRPERALPPERTDVAKGVDEGLLQYVFGLGFVVYDAETDVVHGFHVLLIEGILRPSLTLLAAFDQIRVTIRVERAGRPGSLVRRSGTFAILSRTGAISVWVQ